MLNGGQSSTFWLRFHPTDPGNYSATTSITDVLGNAANIPITATTLDDLITEFPYVEGFEADVFGWVIRDADGDGLNWLVVRGAEAIFNGHKCIASESYEVFEYTVKRDDTLESDLSNKLKHGVQQTDWQLNSESKAIDRAALTPDNWLVSPRLQIGADYTL
ncbi:MAG: hypothetical protein LRZ88_01920 [Candidatus Cloacimonetes bacterium]|nr:hypothetical protein [Candidatus Cloacimonadota bacterium]